MISAPVPDGKHGPRARDRPVPAGPPQTHIFIGGGAAVAVLTLFRARSRAQRRHGQLSQLNLGSPGTGIDEIDEALDRVLAEERSTAWRP